MDWLAELEQGVPEVSGVQKANIDVIEPSVPKPQTDWFEQFEQDVQASQAKQTAEKGIDYLGTAAGSGELVGHLAYGAASWVPSVMAGMSLIGLQKARNALYKRASTDTSLSSEARQRALERIRSPEQIREMVGVTEQFVGEFAPAPRTEIAKKGLEKVGEFFDKLFTWTHQADEFYTEKGYPNFGYAISKMGEMLFFKALHKTGQKVKTKGENAFKGWKGRELKEEVVQDIQQAFDEIGISKKALEDPLRARNQKEIEQAFRKELSQEKIDKIFPEEIEAREAAKQDLAVIEAGEIVGRKEVPSAKEITRKVEETGVEERIERREERPIHLRDVKEERLEAPKVIEPEPSSVQFLNIEERFGKRVAGEISDGIKIAEDMGIYETIREGIEGKKKVGEILKEIKKSRYYDEDLTDFGYVEKDLRRAIKAVKVEEFGDVKVAEALKKRLGKEVEIVKEIKEPKPDAERVDPSVGRPAGVKAEVKKAQPTVDIKADVAKVALHKELDIIPLKTAKGALIKSKVLAERLAKDRKLEGTVVRTPDGKGFYVKKSKKAQRIEEATTKKLWDSLLEDEGLGKIKTEGIFDAAVDMLRDERGSIELRSKKKIRTIRDMLREGKYSREEILTGLKKRGLSAEQIKELLPKDTRAKLEITTESEWLKKGQDPNEFLRPRVVKKKTKGMKYDRLAPAVTRGDAHVAATVRDIRKLWFSETLRLSTSEGVFTQLGKAVKETFYRPMTRAAKRESDFSIRLLREENKLRKQFSFGTRQKHAERIELYAISRQKDGKARLKAQGVKESQIPEKLTPREQKVYEHHQEVYKNLFIEINKARRAAGQQLFPPVENYSPWFNDLAKMEKFEKVMILDAMDVINKGRERLKKIPSQSDKLGRAPGLAGHEKFRSGPDTPGYLHLNTFDNFNSYVKLASRAIHKGPTCARLHELLGAKFKMAERSPQTYEFMSEWLEYQKGREPIVLVKNAKVRRWIRTLSSNIAVSYVTYSFQSALNQMSSLNNTFTKLGLPRTLEGMIKALDPREYKRASRESNILTVRSPEVALIESGRPRPLIPGKVGRSTSDLWRKIRHTGSLPLMVMDDLLAHASWLGAEAKGKRIFKTSEQYKRLSRENQEAGTKKFSKDYADDIVEQAQGSASRAARAPIQRTAEGAAITTLQTFVIAQFDFLSRQVLGIKNPDITKPQQLAAVMRYVMGTAAISYMFDVGGMRSPHPTPAKTFKEEADKSKDYLKATKSAAMELAEYIPIWGGKVKYGSEVTGVMSTEFARLAEGDVTAVARLLGIPGFNQMLKSYRAEKRGGEAVDIVFGRYVEKRSGRSYWGAY